MRRPAAAATGRFSTIELGTQSAEETAEVGRRLAGLLRAGDVLILVGDLGAGKTTLTRGLGDGLGVRGPVTSPTFVISRLHPAQEQGGVALLHVDAYRLAGAPELDDLDLDAVAEDSVTVVEWGETVAESLSASWLRVQITRPSERAADVRLITVAAVGPRWLGVPLHSVLVGREASAGDL